MSEDNWEIKDGKMIHKPNTHRLYWFMYDHFGRAWNDFKDFIGHPSDPKWIRWLVDNIPGFYPGDGME